jgi:cytochrome c biogenesis protein CcdA
MTELLGLGLSFIAGLLTILNPCVLPLVPVVVAGAAAEDARGPLALAAGLALTFGIVGGIVASFGIEFGEAGSLRLISGSAMVLIGLAMALPVVAHGFERVLAPLVNLGHRLSARTAQAGLWGQAGLGALLALIWGPCVGPSLGAAIVLASGAGTLPLAILTMMVFDTGAAASLLLAGYGIGRLTRGGRTRARQSAGVARTILGVTLIAVGIAGLTGWDRLIEGALVTVMPDWLVTFATQV